MTCALIPAAGSGTRTGLKENKIFFCIDGVTVIEKTVNAFLRHPLVDGVCIICTEKDEEKLKSIFGENVLYARGGNSRSESVFNGLRKISGKFDKVLIHDGARPFIEEDTITAVINGITNGTGAVAGVKVTDTIKQIDENKTVIATPDRDTLWSAQTPQGFITDEIIHAYELAKGKDFTDDAAVFELLGKVKMINGKYSNKKITTAEDVKGETVFLSGIGYDVHRLEQNRKLILGGVDIPYELGLLGHSDADVLVHAIMDAILGAAAMGDIGKHFPDTDERYRGISSLKLLSHVIALLKENGYTVSNVSAVVIAQKPKLAGYIDQMRKNIAEVIGISEQRVNIAATTTEHLGFEGRGEGISSTASVMLKGKA